IVVLCMMKILVIAATGAEIALSIKHIATMATEIKPGIFTQNGVEIQFAVTGVGMVATAYHLTKLLAHDRYDLVIQAGICGSFDRSIHLGEVVFVQSDRMADLGAEDGDNFIDVFDLGLAGSSDKPYSGKVLVNPSPPNDLNTGLPAVTALTVNTVTGSQHTTEQLVARYNCQTESMEGAAFHYICICEGVTFLQVRAISNYVEQRNREGWKMEAALEGLNNWLAGHLNFHINNGITNA